MMLLRLMLNKCNDEYRLNVLAWVDGSEVFSFHLDIIHLGILVMLVFQVLHKNCFPLLRFHIWLISLRHCFIPFLSSLPIDLYWTLDSCAFSL